MKLVTLNAGFVRFLLLYMRVDWVHPDETLFLFLINMLPRK